MNKTIGFIGLGNMGKAILEGLLDAKMVAAQNIIVSRRDATKVVRIMPNNPVVESAVRKSKEMNA